jgi:ribonucleoside-diphosphate reductase alpha chain
VYKNFNEIGGIAFLPYDGGQYKQAPYQECDEATYNEWVAKMPKDVPWCDFKEEGDQTSGMQELSCTAGFCEIN